MLARKGKATESSFRLRICTPGSACYTCGHVGARVINERLQLDAPTLLPEGTVLDLVADDEGDDLGEVEREALNGALLRAWNSANGVRHARRVKSSTLFGSDEPARGRIAGS